VPESQFQSHRDGIIANINITVELIEGRMLVEGERCSQTCMTRSCNARFSEQSIGVLRRPEVWSLLKSSGGKTSGLVSIT
jgi:hypothetical protein